MKSRLLVAIVALLALMFPQVAAAEPSTSPSASPSAGDASPAPSTNGTPTPQPTGAVELAFGKAATPQGKTGEGVAMSFPLVNRGEVAATNVLVTLVPDAAAAHFPFEIPTTSLTVALPKPIEPLGAQAIETGQTIVDLGTLQLRGGLASGYYPVPVVAQYQVGDTRTRVEMTLFVKVEGVPEPEPDAPTPVPPPPAVDTGSPGTFDPPVSSGGGGGGGGGADGGASASLPRLMLTSFATDPAEVLAGQNFRLTFTLQNKSNVANANNVKVTIVSGEGTPFLPIGGSSSVYIESVPVGISAGGTIEFRALPTLEERPYQLSIRMEYEGAGGATGTADEAIAVVVKQAARAETSNVQVMPDVVNLGQDANVTFQIHNKGKSKLYNTKVEVMKDQAMTGNEAFVGNIEPGTSGTVDLMLHAERNYSGKINLEVSYEDAAGKVTTMKKDFTVTIEEQKPYEQPYPAEPQPTGGGLLGSIIPLLVAVAIAGGVTYLIVRRRRQAREQAELDEGLELLDPEAPLLGETTTDPLLPPQA